MRLGLVAIAACAGTQAPPPPTTVPVAAAITLDPRPAADDDIVATVDGHPIYASCVVAQAASEHLDKQAALRECIDFELLARTADKRGLTRDPDVVDAWRQAIASAFVDHEYEHKLVHASDFPIYDQVYKLREIRIRHDEFRGYTFVRIPVPPGADDKAHAAAAKIAAGLAGEAGLVESVFDDIADRIATADGFSFAAGTLTKAPSQVPTLRDAFADNKDFGDALFAIPEIGRTSRPAHTKYGWDVILLTDIVPAASATDAEVEAKLVPEARRAYFDHWVDNLGPKHEKIEANLPALENLP